MPFLWEMNEGECLEGIIDLAVCDPGAGTWLVLDWKTNRLVERETGHLHEQYRPQLAAYWKAISAMLGAPVEAGIYSTAAGAWIPYTSNELAATWESLRRDPGAIAAALGAA
jgi:ATP-dependent exoDNAse (exonuclease V) beta subunit